MRDQITILQSARWRKTVWLNSPNCAGITKKASPLPSLSSDKGCLLSHSNDLAQSPPRRGVSVGVCYSSCALFTYCPRDVQRDGSKQSERISSERKGEYFVILCFRRYSSSS